LRHTKRIPCHRNTAPKTPDPGSRHHRLMPPSTPQSSALHDAGRPHQGIYQIFKQTIPVSTCVVKMTEARANVSWPRVVIRQLHWLRADTRASALADVNARRSCTAGHLRDGLGRRSSRRAGRTAELPRHSSMAAAVPLSEFPSATWHEGKMQQGVSRVSWTGTKPRGWRPPGPDDRKARVRDGCRWRTAALLTPSRLPVAWSAPESPHAPTSGAEQAASYETQTRRGSHRAGRVSVLRMIGLVDGRWQGRRPASGLSGESLGGQLAAVVLRLT